MTTLIEMTAHIVAAHAGQSRMTSEDVVTDLKKVYAALLGLEANKIVSCIEKPRTAITVKKAFKKDEIVCMVCGKGGMKALSRHLSSVHDMKPSAYRKEFSIARSQPLAATSFSESRRAMALERGLADNLVKARKGRAANVQARRSARVPTVR
jgi:predicted transcriptional regulator